METIRQVVEVKSDRKVKITLPDTIQPGLVEMVIMVQSIPRIQLEAATPSSNL